MKKSFYSSLVLALLTFPFIGVGQYVNLSLGGRSNKSAEVPSSIFQFNSKTDLLGSSLDTNFNNSNLILRLNELGHVDDMRIHKTGCLDSWPLNIQEQSNLNGEIKYAYNCLFDSASYKIIGNVLNSQFDTISSVEFVNHPLKGRFFVYYGNDTTIILGQMPKDYFSQKWVGDSLLWDYESAKDTFMRPTSFYLDGDDIVVSGRIGIMNTIVASDAYLAKFSGNGILQWEFVKDQGYSESFGVLEKVDDDYILPLSSTTQKIWVRNSLVRLDSDGAEI